MRSLLLHLLGATALAISVNAQVARADDSTEFSAAEIEFFENDVRPLLSKRCYSCHSSQGKKVQGGLRLDSRAAALKGGDTGPAVVPKEPAESLLVDAINYGDLYEMPPKNKLPDAEIAVLTRWVKLGAPWPEEKVAAAAAESFNLEERRQKHWSWRPVTAETPPAVRRKDWPADPLDNFILARLEAANLEPAANANRRTLIRRLFFDLIGMPPTPKQVEAFLTDDQPRAWEKQVDQLLQSKHFGERWARHWLDLMRYAESRGHEFDYTTPNAFEYRDYVIRALNADVPYNEFVVEHVAGDLLKAPRRHPESGANESILGTGFWFLGEWCHSPVDIRKDETDRFDNMIDVFSKSFLGLTVACARCHDHKFDAISQADYYALFGYLQSSAYRQVRFETLAHNSQLASEAQQLRRELGKPILAKTVEAVRNSEDLGKYAAAAVKVLSNPIATKTSDIVLFDFESGDFAGWTAKGEAFIGAPQDAGSIAKYQGNVDAKGRYFINSHNVRRSLEQKESEHSDEFTGELTSREFTLARKRITMLVGGGAHAGRTCVNLLVDGEIVRTATGRNNNRMSPVSWEVGQWNGKRARIQVVDQQKGGWGNIGLDHVVLTDQGSDSRSLPSWIASRVEQEAQAAGLNRAQLLAWATELFAAQNDRAHPLFALASLLENTKPAPEELFQVNQDEQAAIETIADFSRNGLGPFIQDGVSFGVGPVEEGEIWFDGESVEVTKYGAARRSPLFRKLKLKGGVDREAGRLAKWERPGKVLRTKTFTLKPERIFSLVRGRGMSYGVVDSHRMINGPLHGSLVKEFDTKGKLQWVEHNLARYVGHNAHMEFSPLDEQPFEVLRVVQTERKPELAARVWDDADRRLAGLRNEQSSEAELAQATVEQLRASAHKLSAQDANPRDLQRVDLFVHAPKLLAANRAADIEGAEKKLIDAMKRLQDQVRNESRTAPAMWDGTPLNDVLLIRGNNRTPGGEVPRRMLTALGGKSDATLSGSGRLELARQMMSPKNPYAARVMVNRIWGHLTGRPIVPSPDNFGVLGREPSHPKLLDHLSRRFIDSGYSIKKTIREIVLSRTYRMSSSPSASASEQDPNNELLHRMRIRRLEGEAIRDAILTVANRLDDTMYGRSVPVYLTPFMQGRGRPKGGPLDGAGRRSIYVSVRRNFLSPMMLAFDSPQPFSSVGRRTVSNVPAQALILMNDPFVVEMARKWAKESIADSDDVDERISRIYVRAFSRPPSMSELEAARSFLDRQAKQYGTDVDAAKDERLWTDFCHVMFNVKEFIFIR